MRELPTGTVTMLFTDIEGSTRLLQQLADDYQRVIADHHRLLREVIEASGHVVEDRGDGLFAVFARAVDGVAAAVAAQRALNSHPWPENGEVRARIGIHTGEPALVGANYVGLDVHRAARLCDAGHGGQVLVSAATRELVEHQLPAGVTLRDLGEHRLRDLQRPEHLFQAVIAGLPDTFPPPRTVGRRSNNLPVARDPLIGRDADVAAACRLLLRDDVGLVTLTGPGGSGKTRLGLQVATSLLDQFEDGVFLVMLAPISDPDLAPGMIARAIGFRETSDRPLLHSLKEHLQDKQVLLLLDNFEQLLPAASTVAGLLAACPRVKVLVTSRAALRVRGERELPVPPLTLPETGAALSAERLQQYTAVALFAERARAVRPDFEITTENAPAVAEICQRLDGLPLAIELAAARARLLSPQAMLGRLGRRLPFLTGGSRDLPSRQQTLRDTISWSFDLLTVDEQRLFRRLGVFVGGCTLGAIEDVGCSVMGDGGDDGDSTTPIAHDPSPETFDLIGSLVDKSLLRQQDGPDDEPRFSMLATIQEYALEQLEASGEADAIRLRHAEYFARFAEEAEPTLRTASDSLWMHRMEAEHANVRAALAWCDSTDTARHLLPRIAAAFWMFWWQRGYWSDGRPWLERANELAVEPATRFDVLAGQALLALWGGEQNLAAAFYDEMDALARDTGDLSRLAFARARQSYTASMRGDAERGETLAHEAHALALQTGNSLSVIAALNALGQAAAARGDFERAREIREELLKVTRQAGMGFNVPYWLNQLATTARHQGDLARAATFAEEALSLTQQRNDRWGMQQIVSSLIQVAQLQGDRDLAASLAHENLLLLRTIGSRPPIVEHLLYLAWVARLDGQLIRAGRLLGAAEAIRETTTWRLNPEQQRGLETETALIRDQLGEAEFTAAWNEGRALSLDRAVRYALQEIDA